MDEKRSNCEKVEEEVERVVEEAKELQEAAATLINRTSSEEQSLRQRALSLDSNIRRLRSLLHSSISSTNNLLRFDSKLADKQLEEDLQKAQCLIYDGDASAFLPSKAQGAFVKMFIGPINVRASRKDVQLKVKEEYNSYRDRTALLFLLFPSTLLILRSWIWDGCLPAFPVQLYQAWLLFLYTGLALRENILRINGSDIRPWWIYHHYCAMLMALVSLTWEIKGQPNCAQKQRGVQLFLQWAMMQGVAMLLQNRYQRQRLYTRIALGKAKRMDVVWGETAGVDGQLWLLCPILFILQGFEAYVGLLLLKTALVGVVPEWQVSFCGALLVLMAVGNFINTVQTLMTKSRFKAKMKKSKSKPEF
ncbi:TMPIT-like protein [Citrus sinensis]|uniref:TMPIT-like protein n=1 Tax=Citrus sinensis TaxID=2711 RepID=A0ACB8LMW4_CITSI|nr:TMPIT-like protein [Citrus sinensis]